MTAALVDDVVRGSWVRKSETPANREGAAGLFIANLSRLNDAVMLSRGEPGAGAASGADVPPLRVVYHTSVYGQHGGELLTTRTPWPISIYFTATDAGVGEDPRPATGGYAVATPALLWDSDVVDRWHRAIRRRMVSDATFAWAVGEPADLDEAATGFEEFAGRSEAGRVINELRRTLQLSIDDISACTGIARRTLFLWQSGRVTPRASTMRPLWRLHALMRAVVEILDFTGARSWLNAGDPSPLDRLLDRRMDLVEEEVNRIIFRQSSLRPPQWEGARPEVDDGVDVTTRRGVKARTSDRRPQRLRLGESNVRRRD